MYKSVVFKGISKCFAQGWNVKDRLIKAANEKFDRIRLEDRKIDLDFEFDDKFEKVENKGDGLSGVKKVLKMIRGRNLYKKINLNTLFGNNAFSAVVCKVREFEEVDLEMIEVGEENEDKVEKLEFFKYENGRSAGIVGGRVNGLCFDVEAPVLVGMKEIVELMDIDEIEKEDDLSYTSLNIYQKYDQDKTNLTLYKNRRVFDFSSSTPPFITLIKDIRLPSRNNQKQNVADSLQHKSYTSHPEFQNLPKTLPKPSIVPKPYQILKSESSNTSNLVLQAKRDCLKKNLPFQEISINKQIKPVNPSKPTTKSILKPLQSEEEISEPDQPESDFSNYKLTFISSLENLKKPSRLIQFSETTQHSAYSKPDFKSEYSKILIKIYIDCNCPLASKIVSLLNMEKFNIIGLEIPSEYMDAVDMIINLQTAVKFIFNWRVKEFTDIKGFLHTFHRKLLNFESVLLVYVFKDKEFDEFVEMTLKEYSNYMKQFDLSLVVVSTCHAQPVLDCLNQYFEDYIGSVKDLELWNRLQEEISDIVPKFKDSGLNVYAVNVVKACKVREDLGLVDIVNNLGLGSREKFAKMMELLKI